MCYDIYFNRVEVLPLIVSPCLPLPLSRRGARLYPTPPLHGRGTGIQRLLQEGGSTSACSTPCLSSHYPTEEHNYPIGPALAVVGVVVQEIRVN